MSQGDAVAELNKVGLAFAFEFQDSVAPVNEVIATRPGPQEPVPAGSTVVLVISKGGVTPPSPTPSPAATKTP
jgi:beta-lactam-binding protein with PASTA domain